MTIQNATLAPKIGTSAHGRKYNAPADTTANAAYAARPTGPQCASAAHSAAPSASTAASSTAHAACGRRNSAAPNATSATSAVTARFMNIRFFSSPDQRLPSAGRDARDATPCLHLFAGAAETPLALLIRSDRVV